MFYTEDDLPYINGRIASIRLAIQRPELLGQEHSSDSGGSSRSVKEIDYEALNSELRNLMRARNSLTGCGGGSVAGVH